MSDISLSSLLAAALVSALVALGVEWLAKPRLEMRKERILRRWRAKDEVWRTLDRILFAAAIMKNPGSQPEDVQAADAEVLPATADLEETFCEVMLFTSRRNIDLVSSLVGMIRGAWKSDRTYRQKGELLFTCIPVVMDVLGGPAQKPLYWARWRYRARRARQAQAFLDG
jgi:hypothetical protein